MTAWLFAALFLALVSAQAGTRLPEPAGGAHISEIIKHGYAGSSVNVIAGLQNNLVTDGNVQYAAFYDAGRHVVLARRKIGTAKWTVRRTKFTAAVSDAHRTVVIAVDGDGYLHVCWGHHDDPLNYARSAKPGSLVLGPSRAMTGQRESRVTYPSFLRLPDGDLLFLYRDGVSGGGNLVLDHYHTKSRTWTQVHDNLIDGQGKRNAYVAAAIDANGTLQLAWVWRETPNVATNHDLAYACSHDGGVTWETVSGKKLALPITMASADYALKIGQGRSLMNPPCVGADSKGEPLIADYWCPEGSKIPQYHVVYHDNTGWHSEQVTHRTRPFDLAGTNTKHPPISRAVIVARKTHTGPDAVYLVYRDDDHGSRIIAASCSNLLLGKWTFRDLTSSSVGAWEPAMDPGQWLHFSRLDMLVQKVRQIDGDDAKTAAVPASPVGVLSWTP